MIRTLIVDDEPLARDAVRTRLGGEPGVEVVGEAGDGPQAVEMIGVLLPDLVFLDVQMPEMDGFEVLDRVASRHLPVVIFVTAHDQFAVRAFDRHALDYLLKPFSRERFQEALRRARIELERGEEREAPGRITGLLDAVRPGAGADGAAPTRLTRFVARERDGFVLIPAGEVDWIEAAGNYVQLHAGAARHLVRETMKGLEARLDPDRFARIHRSAIVNIDRVRAIRSDGQGDFEVTLASGAVVPMSRGHRRRLLPS
jgi:two-component system, LytTR family, response regulator